MSRPSLTSNRRDGKRNPRRLGAVRPQAQRFTKLSQADQTAFDKAVEEVAAAATALIASLVNNVDRRDRQVEALRVKARNAVRVQPRRS